MTEQAATPSAKPEETLEEKKTRAEMEALAKNLAGLSIGRIVWYTPLFPTAGETDPLKREPVAAIVTRVQNADLGIVALCAFMPFGTPLGWPSVPFSAIGDHGTWRWPVKA